MRIGTPGSIVGLALALCACSSRMDFQAVRYPWVAARTPKAPGCELSVLAHGDRHVEDCEAIGDVFVGDTGWSIDCGGERVLRDIEAEACRAGADTITVRPLEDGVSSCYQARAMLFVCNAEAPSP